MAIVLNDLQQSIFDSLYIQLKYEPQLENFQDILAQKIVEAYEEVKTLRKYPSTYSDDRISTDLGRYRTNIKNLALYDYKQTGEEMQTGFSENGVSRTYKSREKCLAGVIPIAEIIE